MYTVIIAEQEHIDNMEEYRLFLEPFMKKSQFAVCRWKPEEKESLCDSVPELGQTVFQREEWRAVILCDERGFSKKNPFNVIDYEPTPWDIKSDAPMDDFYKKRLNGKKAAYDQAAEEPLVRLVTRLCEDPVIRQSTSVAEDAVSAAMFTECEEADRRDQEKIDDEGGEAASVSEEERNSDGKQLSPREKQAYLEFFEYRQCALYKQELRKKIRGEEVIQLTLPREIICIAQRHHDDVDYELQCFWSEHDEVEYSRFYDWNLYFDKMRYLVFDVDAKQKQNYQNDYLRFLLSVLLLAENDLPQGMLRPNRVYLLDCETDQEEMTKLFGHYNGKLASTEAELRMQIRDIQTKDVERLSDEQAERIFCAGIHIPIHFTGTYDEKELFFREQFGLSFDCPTDNEKTIWESGYQKNRKALKKLLKQPERAVKRATDDVRRMKKMTNEKATALNEFQLGDVRDHIDEEEREMIDTHTNNVYDAQRYLDQMEEQNRKVQDVLDQRMRRNMTLIWGFVCLGLVAVGLIPLFAMNKMVRLERLPLPSAELLFLVALAVVAVAGVLALFLLRHRLTKQVEEYNDAMQSIVMGLEDDVKQYSVYLSHACNVMRGQSVLSYFEKYGEVDAHRIRILQKHISEMEEQQAIFRDLFGKFIQRDGDELPAFDEPPYDYDFSRPVDFKYPLPAEPYMKTQIEFLEKGNYLEIPYGIVKSLTLRREELYD